MSSSVAEANQDGRLPEDPPVSAAVGSSRDISVSIVVPAQDAAAHLDRSLPRVMEVANGADVVVVDAGSRDQTAARAIAAGARVTMLAERAGPSLARNTGVAQTDTEVVIFLDADCVPNPDVVERVKRAFAEDPALVSLTGSYAKTTPERGFLSQYMNLRHHFTHQRAQHQPATFWTGCGAVRRKAFLAVGGFDEECYPNGMEDMELGLRLAEVGHTRLDPDLQVVHLKRWTARGLIEAEIGRRAWPWARLILERGHLPDDLNVRLSQRVAALVAPLALISLLLLPASLWMGVWPWAAFAVGALVCSAGLNAPMLQLFAQQNGLRFASAGWIFHQLHLVYSAATLLVCVLIRPRPPSAHPSRSTP